MGPTKNKVAATDSSFHARRERARQERDQFMLSEFVRICTTDSGSPTLDRTTFTGDTVEPLPVLPASTHFNFAENRPSRPPRTIDSQPNTTHPLLPTEIPTFCTLQDASLAASAVSEEIDFLPLRFNNEVSTNSFGTNSFHSVIREEEFTYPTEHSIFGTLATAPFPIYQHGLVDSPPLAQKLYQLPISPAAGLTQSVHARSPPLQPRTVRPNRPTATVRPRTQPTLGPRIHTRAARPPRPPPPPRTRPHSPTRLSHRPAPAPTNQTPPPRPPPIPTILIPHLLQQPEMTTIVVPVDTTVSFYIDLPDQTQPDTHTLSPIITLD